MTGSNCSTKSCLFLGPDGVALRLNQMSDLDHADILINREEPLPLDLAARLMEQGFDVNTLEGYSK